MDCCKAEYATCKGDADADRRTCERVAPLASIGAGLLAGAFAAPLGPLGAGVIGGFVGIRAYGLWNVGCAAEHTGKMIICNSKLNLTCPGHPGIK